MDNLAQKLKLKKSKFRITVNDLGKKNIVVGCVIGTFIACTPFLFYLYESVPDTQIWSTFYLIIIVTIGRVQTCLCGF